MSSPNAVFLDRDGTLIEDVGVLIDPDDISIFADTVESLLELQKKYFLFVVTNQSGVALGKISLEEVSNVNHHLDDMLKAKGVKIEKWYVCPHDAVTGEELGVFGLYVLTGHGKKHLRNLPSEKLTFRTLGDAAAWIADHSDPVNDLHNMIKSGADALNPVAVAEIFKAKKRPLDDPLIVHVSDKGQVKPLVTELSKKAEVLMEYFWPGPLTLILSKSTLVPDIVTAGNPTVALRMPSNPWALELIRQAGVPVAAPSANLFGYTSPTTAKHVVEQLDGEYEVLIDGGACRVGVESTVLSLIDDIPVLLRPGGVSMEEIQSMIGPVRIPADNDSMNSGSPGMMPGHYATKTSLAVYSEIPERFKEALDVGIILLGPSDKNFAGPVEILSGNGDLREAAVNLYAAMRRLDSLNLSLIATHHFPDYGMGTAINNRLEKAAGERF